MGRVTPDDERLARDLRSRGWSVTPPPPPPPQHTCARCGKTDEENEDEYGGDLIPVRVVASEGEEGHSDVTRWFCYLHWDEMWSALIKLGFESHHHGSTTFLSREGREAPCGGYGNCKLYEQFDGMAEEY